MSVVRFEPSGPLRGTFRPPPDKSISHRAGLLGAIAEGETRIDGYLDAADTRSTLSAIRALGAEVAEPRADADRPGALTVAIRGVSLRRSSAGGGPRDAEIDAGNAGTLIRILPGWLAGQGEGRWAIDGDESLRRRPVDRVAEPLRLMGGQVDCHDGRFPPLRIAGARLHGITYELPVASAQVKSCVLLAGLLAEGETEVVEPVPTRDHTERMLTAAGVDIEVAGGGAQAPARRVTVRPADGIAPGKIVVPGDFSSAAFFIVASLLVPGSEVRLEGVGLNRTRTGLLGVLERMGAEIEVEHAGEAADPNEEPVGSVVARHASLRGTIVSGAEVALAIDELPLVGLLGCFAEGETVVKDAGELRAKESDRIAALAAGLGALGADIEPLPDGFAIRGVGGLRGGTLDAHGDHRLAMLGAVVGLISQDGVEVHGFEAAAVSYPTFATDLSSLL